jgi:ornithine cyclodeaminase/alanine dehydrogenase-like protein (mu-crystallin family)
MTYVILTDSDLEPRLTMPFAIEQMEAALRAKADGALVHPPRFTVDAPGGSVVFTAGAETGAQQVIGFRAYHRYVGPNAEVDDDQIVAVYSSASGALKGVIIGRFLGSMRTAAINGVAIKRLARTDARKLVVIGAGYHARFQVAAAMTARAINSVVVAGRTPANVETFAAEIRKRYSVETRTAPVAAETVAEADILLCATNSRSPILESAWIRPGTHVNSIGPKTRAGHELPGDIADIAGVVVTDSMAQVLGFDPPYFLNDVADMVELDQIVTGRARGRLADDDTTLFSSVGLAGTEVVLANAVFEAWWGAGTAEM